MKAKNIVAELSARFMADRTAKAYTLIGWVDELIEDRDTLRETVARLEVRTPASNVVDATLRRAFNRLRAREGIFSTADQSITEFVIATIAADLKQMWFGEDPWPADTE